MFATPCHDDGIYFDLAAEDYHADPALGSSNLKALFYSPALYWFESSMNPLRPAQGDTRAQMIGTAFHTMVLDGLDAFKTFYREEPGEDYMRLADEIAEWLKARGIKPARTKTAMIEQALEADPSVKILDVALREARQNGMMLLKPEEHARIVQASQTIAANPHLTNAVKGGQREVSVFWTEQHSGVAVRRKARFDYLKMRSIVDLKSIRTTFGRNFSAECLRAIANWRYDMQAAAYMQARAKLEPLVKAGAVFGPHDREWLAAVAAQEDCAFVFVFWASDGAPLTWGGCLSPGNPILEAAERDVEVALGSYARCFERFGVEQPWVEHEPVKEVFLEDMPGYFGRN